MFIDDINAITGIKRITRAEIARKTDATPQNLSRVLNREYIKDIDAREIFKALNINASITYTDASTGNIIYKSEL